MYLCKMENKVYLFGLDIDWQLINKISQLDRFDASWSSIERMEGLSLKQLKTFATIRSVGASTRIEGSQMNDIEVETLLYNINITKLEDRDSQEVVGYFDVLDFISETYQNIAITENSIKYLHNLLLKYSSKDQWHKGDYKQHSNAVEAVFPDGNKQIIFRTTEAGIVTQDAMRHLIDWYHNDNETHTLIKCAVFAYEFVSIHPFQDGNGRLSRLLTTLLLLKNGYQWIEYVSFEHEIENKKSEYYRVLRSCQINRPNENITEWIYFYLNSLQFIQKQLLEKLNKKGVVSQLTPKEKSIVTFIELHSGCKSGEIAQKLAIPNPTVKRILSNLVERNIIQKQGIGAGVVYFK